MVNTDILAIGAHRDDIELTCAATLVKMIAAGHTAAILDLSKGEMGTRGTARERAAEAKKAARILGVKKREALTLPDAFIANDKPSRIKVAAAIRQYRPRVVLAPYPDAYHPDHATAGDLVREAVYLAGLKKLKTDKPWYRVPRIMYYFFQQTAEPSFIVDVSDTFAVRLEAIRAYGSQFFNPAYKDEPTYISRKEFMEDVEAKARYFGSLVGARYGEPFFVRETLKVENPFAFISTQNPMR